MAPKVNGSGNGDSKDLYAQMQAYLEALRKGGKTEKADDTAVVTPQSVAPKTPLTDKELLEAGSFIPGFDISTTARAEAKRNADLEALPKTSLANITREERLKAFNSVDNPLVQAYMYGPISSNTFAMFDKLDGKTFSPEMTADLLADVEIQTA